MILDDLFAETEFDRRLDERCRQIAARMPKPPPCPPQVLHAAQRQAQRLPRWLFTTYGVIMYVAALMLIAMVLG
jgi:type VI protein secretion system component VasF